MSKITINDLAEKTRQGEKAVWLTAHDASSAQLAELAGVDVILVGDSLAMTTLGYDTTLPVCLEQMISHAAAVARVTHRPWLVCDLPFGSYQESPQQAFRNSARLLQQSGCDAVKLEGGKTMAATIRFLSQRGIAVVAHIGLMPQAVKRLGGFRRQGLTAEEAARIRDDAIAVAEAGAVAVVLECIPASLAEEISCLVDIPTVGIGSGSACDAQVLVWHDLLGLSEHTPPFAPPVLDLRTTIVDAISRWGDDVRARRFPHPQASNSGN